jgi:predicted CoA-binding protein
MGELIMSELCEVPVQNAGRDEIRDILAKARTIVVVGLSDDPTRDSHRVAAYLQRQGYRIIPVNPTISDTLGEKAYPSLRDVPGSVDIVDIFRRRDAIPAITEDAIAIQAGAVWMQLGLVHNDAAAQARAAGIPVVMDKCILIEHLALAGD